MMTWCRWWNSMMMMMISLAVVAAAVLVFVDGKYLDNLSSWIKIMNKLGKLAQNYESMMSDVFSFDKNFHRHEFVYDENQLVVVMVVVDHGLMIQWPIVAVETNGYRCLSTWFPMMMVIHFISSSLHTITTHPNVNNSQCSGHFPKCSFIHSHSQDMNTGKKQKQSSLVFFWFLGKNCTQMDN